MSQSAEAMPTRVEKGRFGEGGKASSETLFGDFPHYLNKSGAYHRIRGTTYAVGATIVVARGLMTNSAMAEASKI
jgi:hypothetical protein